MSTRVSQALQSNAHDAYALKCESEQGLRDENARLNAELIRMKLRVLELEQSSDADPLLSVHNRRAFMRELERATHIADRYSIASSVIFFDLNGFKAVNDRFGHAVGDELLRKVGDVLLKSIRTCDLVARLGGDEFGVLLFKADAAIARAKASVLACRIAEQVINLPTQQISVTTAWGVAPCEAGETADQVLARADRAMYVAKHAQAKKGTSVRQ